MSISVSNISFGFDSLIRFPGGSDTLADVIGAGVEVELGLAAILASITGSDGVASVLLLRQLRAVGAQERAVLEVGKLRLPSDQYEVLRAGTKALGAHRLRRNDFAHNVWATSSELPGAVFLMRSTNHTRRMANFIAPVGPLTASDAEVHIEDRDIYREPDLATARLEANEARSVIMHLQSFMMMRRLPPAEQASSMAIGLGNLRLLRSFRDAEHHLKTASKRSTPSDPEI